MVEVVDVVDHLVKGSEVYELDWGLRVSSLGFRVESLGLGVYGSGFRV